VLIGLFVWHCLASSTPLIHPSLFRSRNFTGASLVALFFSAAFGAMLLSIVLWEQNIWGWSALRAGLAIAPGPLMVPLFGLAVAGRLIKRYGPAPVMIAPLSVPSMDCELPRASMICGCAGIATVMGTCERDIVGAPAMTMPA